MIIISLSLQSSCANHGNIKAFRSQLPKENPFYPASIDDDEDNNASKLIHKDIDPLIQSILPKLCSICGCHAISCCSACKQSWYCSKSHQRFDWTTHKTICNNNEHIDIDTTTTKGSNLYPEYDIIVCPETLDYERLKNTDDDIDINSLNKDVDEKRIKELFGDKTEIWEDAVTENEDEDATLTNRDYSDALGKISLS